jgi:hypothetical protein
MGAGVAASGLIVPTRSIFLPPVGGWPHGRIAHASLIIPRSDIGMWAEEIAAGRMAYDDKTEVLSLLAYDERSPFARNGTQMLAYRGNLHERELAHQLRRFEGVPVPGRRA